MSKYPKSLHGLAFGKWGQINARKKKKKQAKVPITINPQRYAPTVESRESFWCAAPRDGFTQVCANHPFRWVPGPLLKPWTHDE